MNTYIIRVTTIDELYKDYIVEAETILEARNKAKDLFFMEFPKADERIKFSLRNPNNRNIKEIMLLFKGE